MTLINKEELLERFTSGALLFQTDIRKIIEEQQEAVVRCKDCKHREAENGFCEGRGWPMQLVPDDGFCDKGERSEE